MKSASIYIEAWSKATLLRSKSTQCMHLECFQSARNAEEMKAEPRGTKTS
jgi:hypothetical protein